MIVPVFDISRYSIDYFRFYSDISPNPEDFELCVARERWAEIEYCRDLSLYWNGEALLDASADKAVLSDEHIYFPRCDAPSHSSRTMHEIFAALGGYHCISSSEALVEHEYWPFVIPRKWTARRISVIPKVVSHRAIEDFTDDKGRFFIKTLHKGWSYSGSLAGFYDSGWSYNLDRGSDDEPMILSEFMDIDESEHGEEEFRIFYIEGHHSISRYEDYEEKPVPEAVADYARNIAMHLIGSVLPRNSVVDVCLSGGVPRIVEVNNPCASGRYIGNTPDSLFGAHRTIR